MMISKLHSLVFETTSDYRKNLETLLGLIDQCERDSLIVAGEVCLSGYDYENFEAMLNFAPYAVERIAEASKNKTVIITLVERESNGVIKNNAYVFSDTQIVHKQPKVKLFKFGEEHNYMQSGEEDDIVIFEIGGVRIGILICFEIRFKKLWQRLEGADIIAVPSWWGKPREQNYVSLTNALAIMNQCYVIASDNLNEECHGQSGIISPFGKEERNADRKILTWEYDPKEIKTMRRYMDVGIK